MNDAFKYEDGTSKVRYIWDQTTDMNNPEGYYFGTEYTKEQINDALKSENPQDVVPHEDTVGHGTFLASLAASRLSGEYIGSAPDAEIIAVKLRKAKTYHMNLYPIPEDVENVYEMADIMFGIEYIIEKARKLNMPVAICIGLGTNQGGHDGFLMLEEYMSAVSDIRGVCICAAARK